MNSAEEVHPQAGPGPFRDPAGFVLRQAAGADADAEIVRLVLERGRDDYDHLIQSGLYERLVAMGLLVAHDEIPPLPWRAHGAWKALRPQRVPFISYAPEWCFSQLRDAALTTLRVQREALRYGMELKDATSANIQFLDGRPVLIDTLSLVRRSGSVWAAYYQFCKHFLAPLLLVAYRDPRLIDLLATEPDGGTLDLASRLLPRRTWLRPGALLHVHLHARAERRWAAKADGRRPAVATARTDVLTESLLRAQEHLALKAPSTEWTTYAERQPTYAPAAWQARRQWVIDRLARTAPGTVWDLGAAAGHMSRLATERGAFTVACDADRSCVESMYVEAKQAGNRRLLPLVVNLLQPPPSAGWAQQERTGLTGRGPADLLFVLGLVHHLAVPGGIPFARQLAFYASLGRAALVEFVPADDPVVRGWSSRFDVRHLQEAAFQSAAAAHFTIADRQPLPESGRVLYHLVAAS